MYRFYVREDIHDLVYRQKHLKENRNEEFKKEIR
jgi:hypothetical protein